VKGFALTGGHSVIITPFHRVYPCGTINPITAAEKNVHIVPDVDAANKYVTYDDPFECPECGCGTDTVRHHETLQGNTLSTIEWCPECDKYYLAEESDEVIAQITAEILLRRVVSGFDPNGTKEKCDAWLKGTLKPSDLGATIEK